MACSQVTSGAMRDLECPVCHELFSTPKMLLCGHSVCGSPCLEQLAGDQHHVKCPECRASHPVPDGGVTNFPTNFFISRIVENTMSKLSVDQSFCSGCSADSAMLKRCYHCGSHICKNCRDEHTDIMKIGLIKQLAECYDKVASDKISPHNGASIENLKKTVCSMNDEVSRISESFHQIIDQRKLELRQSICDFETNEMSKITAHRQQSKDLILAFCGEKHLTLVGDVSQTALVQMEEELSDKIERYKTGVNDVKTSNAAFCIYEKAITQLLSTFGEITIMHSDMDFERDFTDLKHCIGRRGSEPGFFNSPSAVQVSPITGNIVVADDCRRIQIFTSEGKFIHSFTEPYGEPILHLILCNKGHIFMLQRTSKSDKIISFSEKGQKLSEFSLKVDNYRKIITFALAPNGYIHVGKERGQVDVLNKGTLITSYIVGDEVSADRICISESGLVYVLHFTEHKNCRYYRGEKDIMFVFNNRYQMIREINVGLIYRRIQCVCNQTNCHSFRYGHIRAPRGSFRLINDKYILTTDPESHEVRIYDLNWNERKRIGHSGTTLDRLFRPRDAAVTLSGDVVVVSDKNMMQFF